MFDSSLRIAVRCALYTALTLVGGLLIGIAAGTLIFDSLPGHMAEPSRIGLSAIAALIGTFAGGGFWGWLMGRQIGPHSVSRMVWAGALGYGLTVVLLAVALSQLEVLLVERGLGPAWPIHMVFTVLFTPSAAIIAGVGGLSLGLALRDGSLAVRLSLWNFLAGALTFLAVSRSMHALGWVVGAPGAAERFTMLTVMFSGNLGVALVAGGITGWLLSRRGAIALVGKPAVEGSFTN